MKIVYEAKFFDIDYPNKTVYEDTFSSFDKAEKFVLQKAKLHSITNPQWKSSLGETFFNHQFIRHPKEYNACYHGVIREIEVK